MLNTYSDSISTTAEAATPVPSVVSTKKMETVASFILLFTVILSPLAFLPSAYIALDTVKTVLIALGVILSAILFGIIAYKEKKVSLPPRSIVWSSVLVIVSLVVSSLLSTHFMKSFFGQGFELGTSSFILILLLAGLVTYVAVQRRVERVMMIYIGLVAAFLLLFVFHAARFAFGPEFATLGILNSLTSTVIGSWNDLAIFAGVVATIVLSALMCLSLSRRMQMVYGLIILITLSTLFIINNSIVWITAAITFLILTIYMTLQKKGSDEITVGSILRNIAWIPLIACLIAGLFSWKGDMIAQPAIEKLNAGYATLTLPWQYSLDIAAGVLKQRPLFGVGSNHFTEAYLAFKPLEINTTNAWNTEFNYSFGFIPTLVTTQGFFGLIAWLAFLLSVGVLVVRMLKTMPEDPYARFVTVSSAGSAIFLWIVCLVSVPSHAIILLTMVCTALAVGSSVAYGIVPSSILKPIPGTRSYSVLKSVILLLVVIGCVWGLIYTKKAAALAYFGSGIKSMNAESNPIEADKAFASAARLDKSDIYLQAQAETALINANMKIAALNASAADQATKDQALKEVVDTLNSAVTYSQAAVDYDPVNYYNYVSKARVSALAANLQMQDGYETAVSSYQSAIQTNPLNPGLYLALAQFQASQNKLDDALKTVGAALQLKNNYLDAIFLLSQISAAQGNIKDAITAAEVAAQINPQSPVIFFQLGLLQYNDKNYTAAATALEKAVELQPEYANARYFLGLSYARLTQTGDAIAQFEELAVTNPDNQEVALILGNLRAGRSAFADAQPPVTATPEKRATLPIPEKKK